MKKLFVLVSACVFSPAFAQTMCESSVNKAQIAAFNAVLPQEIKPNFFFNKMTCQGDTIGYEYMFNVSTKNNPLARQKFSQAMQPELKNMPCSVPQTQDLKQYGGIQKVHIRILDKDRFVLAEDIVPLDCKR